MELGASALDIAGIRDRIREIHTECVGLMDGIRGKCT